MNKRTLFRRLGWGGLTAVILGGVWLCWWMYECSHQQIVSHRLDKDMAVMLEAAGRGAIETSDSIAQLMHDEAVSNGDKLHEACALYGMGLFSSTRKEPQRLERLLEAEAKAQQLGNDSLLGRIYNTLGSYALGVQHDFGRAHRYYTMATHHARKTHDTEVEMKARCNLSEVMRMMQDTLDIESELEVYRYAQSSRNPRLLNAAAHHVANHYLKRKGEADKALPYIETILEIGDSSRYNILMFDYQLEKDNLAEARRYMDMRWQFDSLSPIGLYNQGLIMNREGRYRESAEMMDRAIGKFSSNTVFETVPVSLALLQARNYQALGDDRSSRLWYERYTVMRDSADRARSVTDAARFKILYNLERKDREIEQARQRTLRTGLLAGFLGFIILAGGMGVLVLQPPQTPVSGEHSAAERGIHCP